MQAYTLSATQRVARPLDAVFAFYAEPRNLARLTPSSLGFRLVRPPDPVMARGLTLTYRIRPMGIPMTWVSEITEYDPPHRFVDEQRRGPYAYWHHAHTFRAVDGGTEVADVVTYRLRFGPVGRVVHALLVRRQLEAIFAFREAAIRETFGGEPG